MEEGPMIWAHLNDQLQYETERGLRRYIPEISSSEGRVLCHNGREFLNFASNNYLGLAGDPRMKAAWIRGVEQYGVGAGSARLINGSLKPLHELERALANFKGTEAALLFPSGYQANVGVLSCLMPAEGIFFSDALNHASIIDGLRLSGAKRVIYPHGDVAALKQAMAAARKDRPHAPRAVVTESVFSMDGDLAPLPELLDLAEVEDFLIYLDEAHGTGVFGLQGAGLAEEFRAHPAMQQRVVQMGTLGKAVGCLGAYVAGPQLLIDYLIQRARTFVYTTGLPPALGVAGLQALEILQQPKGPREILWQRINFFAEELHRQFPERKFAVHSPIFPWIVGAADEAMALSATLRQAGFWVNAIRPPTVAAGTSRLRISLMAAHREDDIRSLVAALKKGTQSP